LRKHFDHVKQHKENELRGVNQIPEVSEVIKSLLFELNQFKQDEENLCEEAASVCHIEHNQVVS
jgi:hypothetical protein